MPTVPQGPLEGAEYHHVKSIREPDDKVPGAGPVLRASIGGNDETGYYFVFRGDPKKVAAMVQMINEVAQAVGRGELTYQDNR